MKIHTSYYGNMRNIPKDYFLVATSGSVPDEILTHIDIWNQKLAPSKDIFMEYKQTRDWNRYVKRFKEERLSSIDWMDLFCEWENLANKNNKSLDNMVLLCYDAADTGNGKGDYCHRHILAESIENEFKTTVKEWGFENYVRNNYRTEIENNLDILF